MSTMMTQVCQSVSNETQISGQFKLTGVSLVGKDVNLILVITNPTKGSVTLNVKITAFSILYTKKEMHELLNEHRTICLKSNEEKEMPVSITYAQYEDLLTADNAIEVKAVCCYGKNNDCVLVETSIVLENPKVEIKIRGQAKENRPLTAEIIFTNPLSKEVTDVVVTAEGSGLIKNPVTIKCGNVQPQETVRIPVYLTPYKSGKKHLLIDLTCNKFSNVKAYLAIEVQSAE